MKTLIVYSTISGNTKAVCERIYNALNMEKEIIKVKDTKNNHQLIFDGETCFHSKTSRSYV